MSYWILDGSRNDGALIDGYPKSKLKNYRYHEGESLAKEFPKKAEVAFSKKWPDRRKLHDFLDNTANILVASSRVRRILEGVQARDLEFLPLIVKDHKGKDITEEYFILNPLGGQDAIDLDKSELVMDSLEEGQIERIKKLVLKPSGIDKQARLFRASRSRYTIFVAESVRTAFRENGVTGFHLYKAEGWNGFPFGGEDY